MKQNIVPFYSNLLLKTEKTIHNADIDNVLESIYNTIMTKIQKYQAEGLGWAIDSVIETSEWQQLY